MIRIVAALFLGPAFALAFALAAAAPPPPPGGPLHWVAPRNSTMIWMLDAGEQRTSFTIGEDRANGVFMLYDGQKLVASDQDIAALKARGIAGMPAR